MVQRNKESFLGFCIVGIYFIGNHLSVPKNASQCNIELNIWFPSIRQVCLSTLKVTLLFSPLKHVYDYCPCSFYVTEVLLMRIYGFSF